MITYDLGDLNVDETTRKGRLIEAGIDKLVKNVNDDRAAGVPPKAPLTRLQIIRKACDDLFQERYAKGFEKDLEARLGGSLPGLNINQLIEMATTAGIDWNPYD